MISQGIEALANRRESFRLSREKTWIMYVHTIHHHGLNIQEGNDVFSFFLSPQKCLRLFYIILFCL